MIAFSFTYAQTPKVKTDLVYQVQLPSKKTERPPVIIMLHGYGSNEADLFDLAKSFDERFLTVSLRAPFAASGQGYCWYPLEFLPDNQLKHDYSQLKVSRNKIFSFISNLCKTYDADSNQVFLLGFSQGAITSFDLAFNKPHKIKGVLALSGLLLDETKKIKTDALQLSKVKFFIAHGKSDNVIDKKKSEEAATFLQSKKSNVTLTLYDMPHSINGKEINDIKAWLKSNIEKEMPLEPANKK
jgi:phospholipase/carboxylesterase